MKKAQKGDTIKSTRTIGDTSAVNKRIKDLGFKSPPFKSQISKTDSLLNERLKAKNKK